ncbi:branched-chain amino acid transport system permease protein [Desulfonatronum thiosulfatophilum]|uniref:Branched-chain amino acid transport system permease protein n=1 Tax=Desulfonatronum thiosulfatophilum TaxID=617002 RepID=A0A1G6A876_9BACT|nr:branched-chain amino acid ABC transporter permease [Desulfonatronum thiosulfatophilum]SDB04605.1 branched-chain amino acid transport system permease protein [Desulfonatronum thiosulfatophilum]
MNTHLSGTTGATGSPRPFLARIWPFVPYVALALAVLATPWLVTDTYLLSMGSLIGIFALAVTGLNLLIGMAGQVSLGQAAFFGMGAYASGILSVHFGVPVGLAMLAGVSLSCMVALLLAIPTLKLEGHYLVMATLGFNIIFTIICIQWEPMTGGTSGLFGIPGMQVGGLNLSEDRNFFYLVWAVVLLVLWLCANFLRTRPGRALRSLHQGDLLPASLGVPVTRYKVGLFVAAALLAALAGSLYAHYLQFISPHSFDMFVSLQLVTMTAIGGLGNLWGGIFGAAFLLLLPEWLHAWPDLMILLHGLILMVVLMFCPKGLLPAAWEGIRKVYHQVWNKRIGK